MNSDTPQPIFVIVSNKDPIEEAGGFSTVSEICSSLAELLGAIAWPLVIAISIWKFRASISSLLGRIKSAKAGDNSVEFETAVANAQQEAPHYDKTNNAALPVSEVARAEAEPRGAVIQAWIEIEFLLNEIAKFFEPHKVSSVPPQIRRRSPVAILSDLESRGVLPSEEILLIHRLRYIRNEASHSSNFSPDSKSLRTYLQLAANTKETLERTVERLEQTLP